MKKQYLYASLIFITAICQVTAQNIESLKNIKNEKPFELSGSISANLGLYSVSGINQRTSPFQYGLAGRLNFKFYGFSVPIYASIRDHSFNYGGALPRIRINPQYKWIKLHIGDTYMQFNPYTLSGRTVRGAGIELTPGLFRFKAIYGGIEDLRSYQDSLQLGTVFEPTYSRKTMGASIGVGNDYSFLDLYAVKTWDKLDSLNGEKVLDDITRQANTVVGSTFSLKLGRSVSVNSNFGLSVSTDNLDAFGENTSFGANGLTGNLVEVNLSSSQAYAGDVGVVYSNRHFSLNGKVRYIQPYYQPLSVAYVNTDLVNYTIGGSFGLFKRKLMFTGSVGIQKNNLSGSKLSTSNQLIVNVSSSFRLSKSISGVATFSNFSQDFEARLVQINDLYTYAIDNKIMSLSLNHRVRLGENNFTTSIRAGRNAFSTIDESEVVLSDIKNLFTGLSFGLSNPKQYWQLRAGLDYRTYARVESETANYGLSLSGNKGFWKNKFRVMLNSAYTFNDIDGFREGTIFRNGANISYKISEKGSIGLRINSIIRSNAIKADFSEIRSAANYNHRF